MKPYIFGDRNGIHIIDLQKTLQLFKEATDFVVDNARQGKRILFVGTKRQAQDAVREEADRCTMYYINNRWLGGLLTNWQTVSTSLEKYKRLEAMKETNYENEVSKKAKARLERQRRKLEKNLSGIRNLEGIPELLVIVDPSKEQNAVLEANKMKVPIVALVDTNCDPEMINYVIPGNDDALRSVRLIVSKLAEAVVEGRDLRNQDLEMVVKEQAVAADDEEKPATEPVMDYMQPRDVIITPSDRRDAAHRPLRPRSPRPRPQGPREGGTHGGGERRSQESKPAPAPEPAPAPTQQPEGAEG